jgi:hypothetical protein
MAVSYEAFRGDREELEQLALASFRDMYGAESFPNIYCARYFDFHFGALDDPNLLIAAYEDDKLMSFTAFIPRKYRFKGETYRAVLGSFLVTRKEALRRGLALGLAARGLELNKEYKYDMCLGYVERGYRSIRMNAKLKAEGQPVYTLKNLNVIIRALDLGKIFESENVKWYERAGMRMLNIDKLNTRTPSASVRDYAPGDLAQCHKLLDEYKDKVTLARVIERDELARELSWPEVAYTLVWEDDGEIRGLINWVVLEHMGRITVPWAWLSHVYLGGLEDKEKSEFIRAFLLKAKEQGNVGVVEFFKNYYPKMPLWKTLEKPLHPIPPRPGRHRLGL